MFERLPEAERFAAKCATFTLVLAVPTIWYFSQRSGDRGLIDIPFMLAAGMLVFLVGVILPWNVGRALTTSKRIPSNVPKWVFFAWCALIVAVLTRGFEELLPTMRELPAYIDAHGVLTLGIIGLGLVIWYLAKQRTFERRDFFALTPTLALVASMWLEDWLSAKQSFGPVLMHANGGLATYLLVIVVTCLAAQIGFRQGPADDV